MQCAPVNTYKDRRIFPPVFIKEKIMTTPKSIRIVSIVSLALVALWLLAVTAIDIFQDKLDYFYMAEPFSEDIGHIFLASSAVNIVSAAVIAVCNILMINGKTTIIPLIFTGITVFLNPIIADLAHRLQAVLSAHLQGADYLAKFTVIANAMNSTSYILNAAFFCTACASAVYAYAKKKGIINETPENS